MKVASYAQGHRQAARVDKAFLRSNLGDFTNCDWPTFRHIYHWFYGRRENTQFV